MAAKGFSGSAVTSKWNQNRVDPFYGYGQLDQSGMAGLMAGEQAGGQLMGQGTGNMAQSLAAYNAMAAGQGPSLATNLARSQTAQNVASQQAMMAQGRGGSAAGQQRSAAIAGQGLQAQSSADVAMIRSQEQMQAMGGAAQLGGQMAQLGSQQQLGYAGMLNEANVAQMNTAAQFQLAQRALQDSERNSRAQRRMGWAKFGLDAGGTVIGAILSALSDERQKENIQPAGAGARYPTMEQGMRGRRSAVSQLTPAEAAYERRDMMSVREPLPPLEYTPMQRGGGGGGSGGAAPVTGSSGFSSGGDMSGFKSGMAALGSAIGGGNAAAGNSIKSGEGLTPMGQEGEKGGLLSNLFSDERMKQGEQPARSQASELAGSMQPYAFDYKPGAGPQGRRLGVMAQDLEQSPLGAALVIDSPQGKQIDVAQAQGAALAMIADQEQRLRQLEGGGAPSGQPAHQGGTTDNRGVNRVPGTGVSPEMRALADMDSGIAGPEARERQLRQSQSPGQRALYNNMREAQERTTYRDEGGNLRAREQPFTAMEEMAYVSPDDRDAMAMGDELAEQEAQQAAYDEKLRADARALAGQIRQLPKGMQRQIKAKARDAVIADEINRLRDITIAAGQRGRRDRSI